MPTDLDRIPPNLRFEVDDLEMPWNFTNKFNFIHTEAMIGAIQDWPKYFSQSFEYGRFYKPILLVVSFSTHRI